MDSILIDGIEYVPKNNNRLVLEQPKPASPSWYVCTRCGSLYTSFYGCGCAMKKMLESGE